MASVPQALDALTQAATALQTAPPGEPAAAGLWLGVEVAVAGYVSRLALDARCDAALTAAQAVGASYCGPPAETAPDGHAMLYINLFDMLSACAKGGVECYARWPSVTTVAVGALASHLEGGAEWLPAVSAPQRAALFAGLDRLIRVLPVVTGFGSAPGARTRVQEHTLSGARLLEHTAKALAAAARETATLGSSSSSSGSDSKAVVWGSATGSPPLATVLACLPSPSNSGEAVARTVGELLTVLQPPVLGLCAAMTAFGSHLRSLRQQSGEPVLGQRAAAALATAWGLLEAQVVPPLVPSPAPRGLAMCPVLPHLWAAGAALLPVVEQAPPLLATALARFCACCKAFQPLFSTTSEAEALWGRGAAVPPTALTAPPTSAALLQLGGGQGQVAAASPLLSLPHSTVAPSFLEELTSFYLRQALLGCLADVAGSKGCSTAAGTFLAAAHGLRTAALHWAAALAKGTAPALSAESFAAAAAARCLPNLLVAAENASLTLLVVVAATRQRTEPRPGMSPPAASNELKTALACFLCGSNDAALPSSSSPAGGSVGWAATAGVAFFHALASLLVAPTPALPATASASAADTYRALVGARVCAPAEAAAVATGGAAAAATSDPAHRHLREAAPAGMPALRAALLELWVSPAASVGGRACGLMLLGAAAPTLTAGALPSHPPPALLASLLGASAPLTWQAPAKPVAEALAQLLVTVAASAETAPAAVEGTLPHCLAAATAAAPSNSGGVSSAASALLQQYGAHALVAVLTALEGGGGGPGRPSTPAAGAVVAALHAAASVDKASGPASPTAAAAVASLAVVLASRPHCSGAADVLQGTVAPALRAGYAALYAPAATTPGTPSVLQLVASAIAAAACNGAGSSSGGPLPPVPAAVAGALSSLTSAVVADGAALLDAAFGKPGGAPSGATPLAAASGGVDYDASVCGFLSGWQLLGAAVFAACAFNGGAQAGALLFPPLPGAADAASAVEVGSRVALLLATGLPWFTAPAPPAAAAAGPRPLPLLYAASDAGRAGPPPAPPAHPGIGEALGRALASAGGTRLAAAGTGLALVAAAVTGLCASSASDGTSLLGVCTLLAETAAKPLLDAAAPLAQPGGPTEAAACTGGVRAFAAAAQRCLARCGAAAPHLAQRLQQSLAGLEAHLPPAA